ncbi:hypothetical protein SGFS_018850 [Streptomyces graminofaciens]|uniref:Uncharacterized protein n=1 Tax=Streptomyces graminofaciens TaxID=68212 RepID=A0ABM7F436_9ACTN|nr:PQQ-binding-like beta-propeller repeat protein [Streptomyces graminofaciens]BBC30591.1 hypothetical protein SGFS_018850 [Streptomyces graminofaciens]
MAVPDPKASRAVLVGVHAYTRLEPLPPVAAGVTRLAQLLRDPSVWGLPATHVTVLGSDASGDAILGAIRDAASECTDTLLVYFAGHGLRDRSGEQLYLALADADDDHPEIGSLSYSSLRLVVGRAGYKARRRITLLDCCYSGLAGGMGAGTLARPDLAQLLDQDHSDDIDDETDGYGSCVLTSAPKTGRSFAPPGARYPEFTGEMIDILDHGIEGAGPTLSPDRMWRLVRRRLRTKNSPEPQQFGHNSVVLHDWVYNRAHQPPRMHAPLNSRATAPSQPEAPQTPETPLPARAQIGPPPTIPSARAEARRSRISSHTGRRDAPNMTRRRVLQVGTAIAAAGGITTAVILSRDDEPGPDQWRLRWRFTAGGGPTAEPSVVGGVLYTSNDDYNLYAVTVATGTQKWVYKHNDYAISPPTAANGKVYFGGKYSQLYAVDATTGTQKWTLDVGTVSTAPVVVDGVVYVGTSSGSPHVYAVNATTGRRKWALAVESAIDASPAVVNGVLYCGDAKGNVYAVDAATGKQKWSTRKGDQIRSSPQVAGRLLYVASKGGQGLYALDVNTGAQKWVFPIPRVDSPPFVVADGKMYVVNQEETVFALDAETGAKRWTYRIPTNEYISGGLAIVNGVVYLGSDDHNVHAIDASTGKKRWMFATGGDVMGTPAVTDGIVYAGSTDKHVYALDAASGKKLWAFKTDTGIFSVMIADGVVFARDYNSGRDYDASIYALDTGPRPSVTK